MGWKVVSTIACWVGLLVLVCWIEIMLLYSDWVRLLELLCIRDGLLPVSVTSYPWPCSPWDCTRFSRWCTLPIWTLPRLLLCSFECLESSRTLELSIAYCGWSFLKCYWICIKLCWCSFRSSSSSCCSYLSMLLVFSFCESFCYYRRFWWFIELLMVRFTWSDWFA